jgi:hypothetical protein
MLTGETVIDGPETIPVQTSHEISPATTSDGYTMRQWEFYPQFYNVTLDIFRKILDGTVRIPTRKEVIDRTKVVIINDMKTGSNQDLYSSPQTLFEGLYRMDNDGNYENNKSFFKKTGRYPTIPTVYQLADSLARTFQVKVNKSTYSTRWPTISAKVTEFNQLFPADYSGDIYAGRHENGWVIYNPYKTGQMAYGSIPFKYNTCEKVELSLSQYPSGVMKEYADQVNFYLGNYDHVNKVLKSDSLKIYGCQEEPVFVVKDRLIKRVASDIPCTYSKQYENGIFSLFIHHNGPVEISVNCSGTAQDRLTKYTPSNIVVPDKPAVYTGPRQYEAENFDYKYISANVTNGINRDISNYTGQGYLKFGVNSLACLRDTVTAIKSGKHTLKIKYLAQNGNVSHIALFINNEKIAIPIFNKTTNEWNTYSQPVNLNPGKNVIQLKAIRSGTYDIYFDHILLEKADNNQYNFENDKADTIPTNPPAEWMTIKSGTAGVVACTENGTSFNCLKPYSTGQTDTGIIDLDLFPNYSKDYVIIWKEYNDKTGSKKGVLLRGQSPTGETISENSIKQGYLFTVQTNSDNTVTLNTSVVNKDNLVVKSSYTTDFTVMPHQPCWYKASVCGNQLTFDCSTDSLNWSGGNAMTDDTYQVGATQFVWGFGSEVFDWYIDRIDYYEGSISVSKWMVDSLKYIQGEGPSDCSSLKFNACSLTDNLIINASEYFEVSLRPDSGFAASITLMPKGGLIPDSTIYIRLKPGLLIGHYTGSIHFNAKGVAETVVTLKGSVLPKSMSRIYTFSYDKPSTTFQIPPALYVSVASGNTATAGVVSYVDNKSYKSNMLRPYSGGQRNSTGVLNLDKFSKTSTDYSVTWKQCVGSSTSDYKVGVLLRGDVNKIGDANTGYVQGMMHGYLFIAYTANGSSTKHSEFRIYRSTEALNTLTMLVNTTVSSLIPTSGQPIWYRASAAGTTTPSLKLEYSTDSLTWNIGAVYIDTGSSTFTAGATQLIWGLGVPETTFYVDDILFEGIESANGLHEEAIVVSDTLLSDFVYSKNNGPSEPKSFMVSGNSLVDDIHIEAPAHYEVSLSPLSGYTPYLPLPSANGSVTETNVYVRLKAGLNEDVYNETITLSSIGSVTKEIRLMGLVQNPNSLPLQMENAEIISREYYTLPG